MADPYSTLGVARGATEKDIKSAYRNLAKELHPDRNTDNPKAAERFSDVTKAYDLLSDKDKRARFDRGEIDVNGDPTSPFGFGRGGAGGGGGGGFRRGDPRAGMGGMGGGAGAEDVDISDLFEGIFGGGRSGGMGGAGMGGAGMGGRRRGPAPKGANVQYRLAVTLPDLANLETQRITLADGKTIDLKLPPGAEDGTQMRLTGKGEPGQGGNGDAIVTIVEKAHAIYHRDNDAVRIDLPVTLDEALNGAKVKVPTVEGPVMLTIAPGSSSGKVLRLKGRGFTRKAGGRGDQLVTLVIDLPDDDETLKSRLAGWKDNRAVRAKLGV